MKRLHKSWECLIEPAVRLIKLLSWKYPMAIIDLESGALNINQIQTEVS